LLIYKQRHFLVLTLCGFIRLHGFAVRLFSVLCGFIRLHGFAVRLFSVF